LVEQFNSTRVFWRQFEVAKKIVERHDSTVLPQLEFWLTHDDRHLRANAAFIFASLGDDRGFDVIVAILDDRSKRPEGQGVAVPLRASSGPELEAPDGQQPHRRGWSLKLQIAADRYYAVHILGDLKDRRAVPILVPLLADTEVNSIVPWALSQIGDRYAIRPLIAALGDRNPNIRVLVILALEDLKAVEALPHFRLLLDDNERSTFERQLSVAEAARSAIAKLEATSR
jgi:HEAT repeat protein